MHVHRKKFCARIRRRCLTATRPRADWAETADQGAAAQTPILQQYDQAIDQVAERAMQSVVKIEVTGYGVPESDKTMGPDQGQQQRRSKHWNGSAPSAQE